MKQKDYKKDFPLFSNCDVTYLDNAATAQRPVSVLEAERKFYENYNANPLRGLYPLSVEATREYEDAREAVCGLLGAGSAREIIFTRNTTESLNLVAYSYGLSGLKQGDEILVSVMEHHSNLLPWQMVAKKTGASLRFMECEMDGSLELSKVEKLITDKTRLVAVTQLSNVLGREYPIRQIAEMAHRKNAVVVVDGAQSTPHVPVDVTALGADFFAFSGHKLYGPMGIGVLYGKQELLEEMPPFLTGGEMIESVTRQDAVYGELPHKFEAGTVNAAGAAGLKAAISYLQGVGFETIRQREQQLAEYTMGRMKEMPGIHILGSENAAEHHGIITFLVDQVHPHDVSEILASDGIAVRAGHHCAQPLLNHLGYRSTTRVSFAFYNTREDADCFLESLQTIRERMGYGK